MRLAFLIPSKNRGESLGRSLPSLLRCAAQSSAEILICDQSDRPFASGSGYRVQHCPDLPGLPAARNALLGSTSADVVCFLDDDTTVAGDFGERLLEHARAEPEVLGWGPVVETRPLWTRRAHRLIQLGVFRDPRRLLARRIDRPTGALFGCCFAVRRAAALEVGFDASRPGYALGEDRDFFRRLALSHGRAAPLRFCGDLRAVHRRDGNDRADARARGRMKADFVRWWARKHGGHDRATVVHAAFALLAAAYPGGMEAGDWRGVVEALISDGRRSAPL